MKTVITIILSTIPRDLILADSADARPYSFGATLFIIIVIFGEENMANPGRYQIISEEKLMENLQLIILSYLSYFLYTAIITS
jgi:hypothetical protein